LATTSALGPESALSARHRYLNSPAQGPANCCL
jgi:hypothetical protein